MRDGPGMNALSTIGTSDVTPNTSPEFREMTVKEIMEPHSFSDHFRFSFTIRMDRDEALALSRRLEYIVSEALNRDCRVYVGVPNRDK